MWQNMVGKMKSNKLFWVLESKNLNHYFGILCGDAKTTVSIYSAIKFADRESAENMLKIFKYAGVPLNLEPMEHSFFEETREMLKNENT